MTIRRVAVLLPYPFDRAFDYAVPAGMELVPGAIVTVPLGKRMMPGAVWDDVPDETLPDRRLKPVAGMCDAPALPATLRRFVDWVAQYTMAPRGEVLALALKSNLLQRPPESFGWAAGTPGDRRMTASRGRVLAALAELDRPDTVALAQAAGVSAGVVRAMADAGFLVPARRGAATPAPDPDHAAPNLSPEQAEAATVLRNSVAARRFGVTLLEGVTGSGKTEVYLEAVAEALRQDRQALVLLPEIALSAQFTTRFAARFGAAPTLWHSGLTPSVRRANFHAVARGASRLVVGARSALFLPFADLGVVVVDEEHESAYKQEDGVAYHARDMAVVRARLADAAAILASATPSLESAVNADSGRYAHITLAARHGGAALPAIAAIDLRAFPPPRGKFLSPVLTDALAATLAGGGQAMLFLNRRGYAPLTLCRACGHRITCPNCTAWLVAHRAPAGLLCHHCGHTEALPETCPSCGAAESMAPIGPGVERIAEEAAELFPDMRRIVMASDAIASPDDAAAAARAIVDREVDLIIGTQMIAKGWHFPDLALVGVVDADLGLSGGDLRAAERSAQLLHQVAGRAGRAGVPGRVLLQSFAPDHPVMRTLIDGDLAQFRRAEAALRAPGHWPPFGRLAALIVSAADSGIADTAASALARAAPPPDEALVLGPAPAPFALLRGRHRRRLLLRTPRNVAVQPILRAWLERADVPRAARVDIDIDPVSFL
ncbi:primosomal protein N' [Acidiphilium sp. AL]|uniref:primosomal protein N' n=1 Tax=Acidiphilium sp. AL TaxID=2871704 RepID=UPI0021CB5227|nr:primosomal protein N' [Acidiphilium sp. AL]MCU4159314.1 primosomal protein N' [Acidiphilium sp. AL]